MQFRFDPLLPRVRFGRGSSAELDDELERLGISRALVISTPGKAALASRLAQTASARLAGMHPEAVMHTPVAVSDNAAQTATQAGADGLLAIGGGSTVNLAKAIALRTGLPIVAVPTTYAGSEMTTILGETERGRKRTLRDPRLLPRTVIYDPQLLDSFPAAIACPSLFNALAHAAEALYADNRNAMIEAWAVQAIGDLAGSLPAIAGAREGERRPDQALAGAWLAGACLGAASMGLHHKICHTLGGSFGLPHADTHAVMLPYTFTYNATADAPAAATVAQLLNARSAGEGLYRLLRRSCPRTSLKQLGLAESDLDRVTELSTADAYPNPRPLDPKAIHSMLARAWAGQAPEE